MAALKIYSLCQPPNKNKVIKKYVNKNYLRRGKLKSSCPGKMIANPNYFKKTVTKLLKLQEKHQNAVSHF